MEFFLIFFSFLAYQLNCSITSSSCENYEMKPEVSCYQFILNCYILEGDEENYSKLQHINKQIIKKSFAIPYKVEPILIRIINSPDAQLIHQKLMCFLLLQFEYYITCMGVDLLNYEEQTEYAEKFEVNTKIQFDEYCDEMFTNYNGSFILFCLNKFTLKQYTVEQQGNRTLNIMYDVLDQIQDKCKKKQIKLAENQYIVVLYQCSKWIVLLIENKEVKTLLNSETIKMEAIFSYIDDVSFCELKQNRSIFFLVENNSYLQVYLNKFGNNTINYFFQQNKKQIQKLLVQKCQIVILLTSQEYNEQINIQSSRNKELVLNQKYSTNNIHFHSDLIFLQNQSELIVLINAHLNQTFQIFNTSLHFFAIGNLFCQFDQIKKVLQFYKYYPLTPYIQPQQKYLYLIQKYDLFNEEAQVKCLKIVFKAQVKDEQQQLVQQIKLFNNCSSKLKTWISEVLNSIYNVSFNLNNNESSLRGSIWNYHNFQESCFKKLKLFQFIDEIEFIFMKIPLQISFINKTNFYIFDCKKNKIIISISINQFDVLESNENYYLYDKNTRDMLRVIQIQQGQLLQYNLKFDGMITNIQKFPQQVLIYMNNSELPIILSRNFNELFSRNYLQKNLYQSEHILFYQEIGSSKFIQYQKFMAMENQENIKFYELQNTQIISIQYQVYFQYFYLVFAVQNFTQSLTLYFLDENEIHQISNYTLQNYQFYYPFKYAIKQKNLAILIEQNGLLFIAIFLYNPSFLQLFKIIATDNSFFTFYKDDLIYSNKKVWTQLFINIFIVEVETQQILQNSFSSPYLLSLPKSQQEEQSIDLKILIINQCFQLYSLKNLSIFEIQQNQNIQINISDLFYGPINNLTLITNQTAILNGPLILRKQLQQCNSQLITFCIKYYKFEIKQQIFEFQAIIFDNQIYEILHSFQPNSILYITWIKQQYYVCFLQLNKSIKIHLIQCFEKNDNCQLISDLNDNVKLEQIDTNNIKRTGNLIKILNNFNYIIISVEELNFNIVESPNKIEDIIFIEKSQDQYLILQKNNIDSFDLQLTINSINQDKRRIIYSYLITKELQIEFNNYGNKFNEESIIKLISCNQNKDLIYVLLFIADQQYSYVLLLQIDQKKHSVQIETQKLIRNKNSINLQDKFILHYLDENYLILKQIPTNTYFFYQLKEERKFYDYFYKSLDLMYIKRVNNTHFIFRNHSSAFLGIIGFEIELQSSQEQQYNFLLQAQNEISFEKVSLHVHILKQNDQFLILIQSSCLIFIIIYLKTKGSKIKKLNSKQADNK
ncbi:unnamed protein product [Paramecium sonneborni]|uniref:Transmembrane protein n=1 Tax=Paramecium sonneborni TaxID=65129 RepID=A0A8S1PXH3_9CILI|nr:unnamed protein product [Paramecium sonneborni]